MIPTELEAKGDVKAKIQAIKGGDALYRAGLKFINLHAGLKSAYMIVADIIRTEQMKPAEVRLCLAAAGWSKERISEVCRVAMVSEKLWSEFKKKFVGFKLALAKAREEAGVGLSWHSAVNRWISGFGRLIKRHDVGFLLHVEQRKAVVVLPEIPRDGEKKEFDNGRWRVVVEKVNAKKGKVKNEQKSTD